MVAGCPWPFHPDLLLRGMGSCSTTACTPLQKGWEKDSLPTKAGWKLLTRHKALLVPPAGLAYRLSLLINNFTLCQQFSPDILYLQVKSSTAYVLSLSWLELLHFLLCWCYLFPALLHWLMAPSLTHSCSCFHCSKYKSFLEKLSYLFILLVPQEWYLLVQSIPLQFLSLIPTEVFQCYLMKNHKG